MQKTPRAISILFLLLSFYSIAFAQNKMTIDTIAFEGLKKTKSDYLLGFLDDLTGMEVTETTLNAQVQKLKNVPGIGNATYKTVRTRKGQKVIFIIEEQTTRLPILNFGGIKGNVWFQAGAYDINWRGRGEFLIVNYQNTDRRHGGQIYYRVPFFRSTPWGFSLSLTRLASREPLYFDEGAVTYFYDNNSAAFTILRYFGINRNIEIGGTFFQEKYKKTGQQELTNPPGPEAFTQPKYLSKFIYQENFLNYDFIYLQGRAWQVIYENVYNTIYQNWFHSLQLEGRQFLRFGKGNLAIRLRLAIASNDDSPFAPFVVDSHVNLRGSGNRIDRGTAQIILNTEHRQTIFSSAFWAGQVVVFSDLGNWRTPGGELNDLFDTAEIRQFIGGGFRLSYQKIYSAVLRVDYGVDIFNTESHGLVVGLGQYF